MPTHIRNSDQSLFFVYHSPTCFSHSWSTSRCTLSPPDHPLRDVRVAITAPYPYLPRLAAQLHAVEARPICMPTVTTRLLPEGERDALEDAVLRLCDYDLVVFPSRNAVLSFADVLNSFAPDGNGSVALRASGVKLAALGADAHAVKDCLQCTVDYVPPNATPEGLVDLLEEDLVWEGRSVLVPIPTVSGIPEPPVVPNFLEALRTRVGCKVFPVAAYITEPVSRQSIGTEIELLLRKGTIAAIVFSSTAEAIALRRVLDGDMANFLHRVNEDDLIVAAHGPVTADGIKDNLNLDHVAVSEDSSSFAGVVSALWRECTRRFRNQDQLVPR